jgi:hypothetical protein
VRPQRRALYADCITTLRREREKTKKKIKKKRKKEIAWENHRRPLMAQLRLLDECGISLGTQNKRNKTQKKSLDYYPLQKNIY